MDNQLLKIRQTIFKAGYNSGMAHLASSFSSAELIWTLYNKIMTHFPKEPENPNRDIFILSKGHASLALYAVLAEQGYFSENELIDSFAQPGSYFGGEPHCLEVPGIEASTGSLGHGLSIAVGYALALKADNKSNKVICLVGDGECQEGSIWEAIISAAAFNLDNLTLIIDNNHIQKMGELKEIVGQDNLAKQIESFGWDVKPCNGHDIDDIFQVFSGEWQSDKPKCLMADCVKGKGVSLMENNPSWHWRIPNKKEYKIFEKELEL